MKVVTRDDRGGGENSKEGLRLVKAAREDVETKTIKNLILKKKEDITR